jgi:hypothetical protein
VRLAVYCLVGDGSLSARFVGAQAQEKVYAAEAESLKMRKQIETLEADKAKLTGDVEKFSQEKAAATQNWKKWSDKATKKKDENLALVQERDNLKRVSGPFCACQLLPCQRAQKSHGPKYFRFQSLRRYACSSLASPDSACSSSHSHPCLPIPVREYAM